MKTLPEAHARAMRDLPEMLTFARAMAAALPEEAARWTTRAEAIEAALQILRVGVPCPMPGARLGAWLDPFGGVPGALVAPHHRPRRMER